MKPLRKRLEDARKHTGLPWEVVERDYILSWILAGIGEEMILRNSLIFKGGTALKKCYFGEYRFSEDLDFTATEDTPGKIPLEEQIKNACVLSVELADRYTPIELQAERYLEKQPHPGGQEAFLIRARLPWHRQFLARVMVEVTFDEPVMIEPVKRKIIHEYGEELLQELLVYSLEEIVAEKMRAVLQHLKRLEERGWSRSRARDYYDLWKILNHYKDSLGIERIPGLFLEKCKVRDITFQGPEDFFSKTMVEYIQKTWQDWLGPLVPELPEFELVLDDLRYKIVEMFKIRW